MRILFISREYPPETDLGGIGSYASRFGASLVILGHEVHVLSCFPGQATSDNRDWGVHVHRRGRTRVRGAGRVRGLASAERIAQTISAYAEWRRLGVRFDVVQIPDWMGEGLLLALRHATAIVARLHTPLRLIREHDGVGMQRQDHLADLLERTAVRCSHVVTAASYLVVERLEALGWLKHDRVRIVRNPIDLDYWAGLPGAETTEPVILQVGRVEPRKGADVLLEAVKLLSGTPRLRVVFAGRAVGPYKDRMRAQANTVGVTCEFIGQKSYSELRDEYARTRVVAVPSRFDNFSNVALEAMAAARPVVMTEAVGIREILNGGSAASVVPPGDPRALAAALRSLITSPERAGAIGRDAQALVTRTLAPERIAREHEVIYREAAAAHRRGR